MSCLPLSDSLVRRGTPWEKLFNLAVGNIIINVLGFVPGYYVTLLTIEKLGRKVIQLQGFLMAALFLGILAGKFDEFKHNHAASVVCFTFLQFFFNFGANSTTFCYPAEVFPTKYRAFAHAPSLTALEQAPFFGSFSRAAFSVPGSPFFSPRWPVVTPTAVLAAEIAEKRAARGI
ncbi:hypothetical protein JVU11DRAFT_7746 [Chiua virens]|nr:hypothetical protein JVU11DRAFT_7746 [Chiua virens]